MSDIKRIQLTTISDVKKNVNDINNLSSSQATRYEINVDLFEPNTKSFPEFNYKKLLHAVKKKQKKTVKSPPNGFSDPFEENDADVERIAREFEAKYGGVNNSYSGGKKTNRPKITSDFSDKGAGYDDNDSFIDNTEAYDELIPEEIDTVSGGFYINSGALEFKHLSNYERPEDAQKMPKPRKRIISSSSSSSGSSDENDDEIDENNHESDGNGTENNVTVNNSKSKNNGHADKKIKVLNTTSDEEKQAKQAPTLAKPITKDKDKKIKKETNKKDEVVLLTSSGNTNINSNNDNNYSGNSNTNASNNNIINNNNTINNNNLASNSAGSDRDKPIKTTTVKDMLRAKRDSILILKENAVKGDSATVVNIDKDGDTEVNDEESTSSSLSSSSSNEPAGSNAPASIPKSPHANIKDTTTTPLTVIETSKPVQLAPSMLKLPANVSTELLKCVEELKDISQKYTLSGAKTNFFDTKTMDLIMKIDAETRNGDGATRSSIFQYLEQILPFTQKTIMGHIRKVRVQTEENKLTKYCNKLKSAVDLVLPSAIESYKEECQKVNQIRSSMLGDDKSSNGPKMPRKRFPWNDNTRKLLFDLYTALKLSYNIVKPRKETVDSYIENYYKTKLINLWPAGWMRLEELNKEIERRKLGVKKPKENKKPADIAAKQLVNSVNSTISNNTSLNGSTGNNNNNNNQPITTVSNQSNMDASTNVIAKESNNNNSKSILATNNAFPTGGATSKLPSSQISGSNNSGTTINVEKSSSTISSSNSNQIYNKNNIDKTENYDINKKSSGNTSNQVVNASTINLTNSLTITPVKTTGSASTSKPLPSVENKVTITNVDTTSTPLNNSNHHSSTMSSKPDLLKSTKQSSSSSSNNNSNNNNLGSKSISSAASTKQSANVISISPAGTANAVTMQSPTSSASTTAPVRKTSDYSINSIMSTTTTTSSTTGANSLNLNSAHSNYASSTKGSPFSVTEICNINNKVNETIENSIKSKSDTNTLGNNSSSGATHNSNSSANHNNNMAHKDSVIKVRSVANMNSSIRDNTSSSKTGIPQSQPSANVIASKKSKKTVHNSDDDYDDGSDSSDVEIVDVYQPKRNKRDSDIEIVEVYNKTVVGQQFSHQQHQKNKNITINKNKYNKNSYVDQKLNNYISNNNPKLTAALANKKEDSNMNKLNPQSNNDSDLDVLQIMKDLKELQELQQPKYSMHALDTNLALSKQNQHSTGYGKSLKDSADTNILMSQYLP